LDVVAALHALCFDEPWDREALGALLTTPGGFGCLVLDAEGSAPVGFVLGRVAANECDVLSIGVVPASRRRGWGGVLVHALISEALARGADTVVLEVAEDNDAAIALYRALGFVVVGRRPAYYRRADDAVDAHIMRRAIGNDGAPSRDVHD
jgi:ribosomal-protein-alanine N-acetyltransferase